MPNVVDLFCGSGGVSLGLRAAGWKILAACDNDPFAAATYKSNHPDTAFIEGDIEQDKTVRRIAAAVRRRKVDLLVICAPCQPFSSQNRHRGDDEREQLIVRALALAARLKPRLIFFENVPGLATPAYQSIVAEVRFRLAEMGYVLSEPLVRDAALFGVPQRRKRCIMVAAKCQKAIDAFLKLNVEVPEKTVLAAISDLPKLASGEAAPDDALHRARSHLPIALERLSHIPRDGGSRKSLPERLQLNCHKGKDKSFSDVYGRMAWKSVAPTLTTGCTDITRGRFAHPEQDRAITLREAARIQSFPDDYVFSGSSSDVARQIGNAVPPDMIKAFAPAFAAALAAGAK
uniref:Cytosine-specific methyltransferase n=1 Tax=Bosea sp. NBC_00436 TaxID=2969620 RepID=A0A9E7ZXB3_9HYPH